MAFSFLDDAWQDQADAGPYSNFQQTDTNINNVAATPNNHLPEYAQTHYSPAAKPNYVLNSAGDNGSNNHTVAGVTAANKEQTKLTPAEQMASIALNAAQQQMELMEYNFGETNKNLKSAQSQINFLHEKVADEQLEQTKKYDDLEKKLQLLIYVLLVVFLCILIIGGIIIYTCYNVNRNVQLIQSLTNNFNTRYMPVKHAPVHTQLPNNPQFSHNSSSHSSFYSTSSPSSAGSGSSNPYSCSCSNNMHRRHCKRYNRG